jgi:hypothetical protein
MPHCWHPFLRREVFPLKNPDFSTQSTNAGTGGNLVRSEEVQWDIGVSLEADENMCIRMSKRLEEKEPKKFVEVDVIENLKVEKRITPGGWTKRPKVYKDMSLPCFRVSVYVMKMISSEIRVDPILFGQVREKYDIYAAKMPGRYGVYSP